MVYTYILNNRTVENEIGFIDLNQLEIRDLFRLRDAEHYFYLFLLYTCSYILPTVSFVGIVCNLINTIVLIGKLLKNAVYKYLLVIVLSNLLNSSILFAYFIFKFHFSFNSFWMRKYELYAFLFLSQAFLTFFLILVSLMTYERFLMISSPILTTRSFRASTILVGFLLSLLLSLFNLFGLEIVEIESKSLTGHSYILVTNETSKTRMFTLLMSVSLVMRGILLPLVAALMNLALVYRFKRHVAKKSSLKANPLDKSKHFRFNQL